MLRLLPALILALLSSLLTVTPASALSALKCIKGHWASEQGRAGAEAGASARTHQGIWAASTTVAVESPLASRAAPGASSALKGAQLSRHLAQLQKYGKAGFKELQNGRIRYFGELQKAAKQGEMAGRRLVREWNPATNATRTWHETLDHAGRVRIVRPEAGGPKVHYMFDELGNFTGTF